MRPAITSILTPAPSVGRRILICEDDYLSAQDFASILRESGYEVDGPAHTAEEALAAAYQHLPDVALIDIGLSGAIDGISVAAELAPLGVPIIFLTGDYQRACVEGRELAADILIKPISEIAIIGSIASVLQPKHGSGERR